jgi:hypothetical protein
MGFLGKIFGKKISPAFWEDDYCPIEVVSEQNTEYIIAAIKQIKEFTAKTRYRDRYTDVFCRENLPFPTKNEKIRIDYLENKLAEKGFEKAKQIRYNGYSIKDSSNVSINAFSLPCFIFFYDCSGAFINNIWLSSSLITSNIYFDQIMDALYELGTECQFVLIDWNSPELVNLADKKQIQNYLMNDWK